MYSGKPAQFHYSQPQLWQTVACASLSIAFGIISTAPLPALSQSNNRAPEVQTKRSIAIKSTPSPAVIQSIQKNVKKQFGVPKILVVSMTEQEWPDGCLGLAKSNEACTAAIVPGWRVEVTDNLQTWFYRTDRTGKTLRLENPDRSVLPQAVALKLIQQVGKDTNTPPPNKLRITAVQTKTYDGCLGIYRPNQVCTQIALSGWQAIVTSPQQTYVYHLDQNATRIAQNKAASGAQRKVNVSFEKFGEIAPLAANEIFRSSVSSDMSGRMTSTVLTKDGKITRYQSSPTARFAPVVVRTLSTNQLVAFIKVLENRQFQNLNGLSYLTSAALADYPTTTYQSQGAATQFIDLEKKSLPRSLQQVISSWESLIQPVK
jgi:hypothetical protein